MVFKLLFSIFSSNNEANASELLENISLLMTLGSNRNEEMTENS